VRRGRLARTTGAGAAHRGAAAPAARAWARRVAGVALLALAAGCSAPSGPPAIRLGSPCAGCGMTIEDLRFACERRAGSQWRAYDSIECLLRDGGVAAAFLADYDTRTLHAADSLWVVEGSFPSPMGGGLAAFAARAAADTIAARTAGRVARLADFAVPEAR